MESYALLQYAVQYESPRTANSASSDLGSIADTPMLRVATYGRSLKVRSGPGLKYDVVSSLANKTVFCPSGDYANGWIKLTSGGWVSRRCTRKVRRIAS
ncbi:MAG: SH3 domain-containing protein [Cyanobacteria bacterium P01_A01_bin.123]